jgi:hypothetical protein
MRSIDFRIRIAILWALWAAAMAFGMLLWLLVAPGALEEALAGEMEGMASDGAAGYVLAFFGVVPLALAVMTLQIDNRVTRYTNLVAGLLVGAWGIVEMVTHLADGGFNASMLVSAATILIAFLIAGLSAAALRRGASERTARTHEVIEHQAKPLPESSGRPGPV